jgi:recombination associated protein RdgC
MFKNISVYRMTSGWSIDATSLEPALAACPCAALAPHQAIGHGFEPVYDDAMVHVVNGQMLLQLKTEKKVVPPSALKAAIAVEVERRTGLYGHKPGKKETREIKDEALNGLLPQALSSTVQTQLWIDPSNGWIVVNTGSPARADVVINNLISAVEKMQLQTLYLARDVGTVMTEWLSAEDNPGNFTIDSACELRAVDESKAKVKYDNINLDADDLREHIRLGKRCVKLALTWNGRVSFDLTDKFKIKRISFLEAVFADQPAEMADDRERQDADFVIMTGELNAMMSDLIEALGGEAPRESDQPSLF